MTLLLQTCNRARVLIATPTYGDLTGEFAQSLFSTAQDIDDLDLLILMGHCHVDDARNTIVRTFLAGPWEELVFIDADVSWKAKDLKRLLAYDVDVVAGAYPLKQDEPKYPIQWLGDEAWGNEEGLIEVKSVATGFLRIKRHVLEMLAMQRPTYKAKPTDAMATPLIFERTVIDGVRIGGDVHFCYQWRDAGGAIYIAPDMTLEHKGAKTWSGNLGFYLKSQDKSPLECAFDLIEAGNVDDHVFAMAFKAWGNNYAAGPGLLSACYHLAREADGPILEYGSGLSSLVMAAANPARKVWALEYDSKWADECRSWAEKLGLNNLRIIDVPLIDGWYDWRCGEHFALCLVDGPSRKIGDRSNCVLADADTYIFDDATDAPVIDAAKRLAEAKGMGIVHLNASEDRSFAIVHRKHNLKAA